MFQWVIIFMVCCLLIEVLGSLLVLGEELGYGCVVVLLPVELVECSGDYLGCFHEVTFYPCVIAQTGGDVFRHGHGQFQGIQFIGFPGCLGICQGLGPFGGVGGFSSCVSWIGGGVASLAVGALPLLVATL